MAAAVSTVGAINRAPLSLNGSGAGATSSPASTFLGKKVVTVSRFAQNNKKSNGSFKVLAVKEEKQTDGDRWKGLAYDISDDQQDITRGKVSASASTYIDAICQRVSDKAFCGQTLNAYPPAASATSLFQAAEAALNLAMSHADKSAAFAGTAANKNPSLMKQFKASQDAFVTISRSLKSASLELKESPDTANYDVMQCSDSTTMVKNLVGKNTDKDSKTIMTMTSMMEKLLAIGVGATEALGG